MLHLSKAIGLLACGLLLVAGCKDKPKPAASVPTSATATAPSKPPPVSQAKALDVASLQKSLRCAKAGAGPCAVLAQFKNCVSLAQLTGTGESRYLGEGYVVRSGAFVDEFTVLRRRQVPTSNVAPGQMPSMFGIGTIEDSRADAKRHARKAIAKFRRGDVTKVTNAAVRYVKERNDWTEANATPAAENQIYIASDGATYLCPLKDQRVLLVRSSSTSDKPGDGVYATLWPVSW
jgi:hypothetical protein